MDSYSKTIAHGNEEPTRLHAGIRVRDERSQREGELLLERYRLIERLGAGGFGTVWHAHDELLDRPVALKRIPLPSEEDRERAMREALASARLAHPAIVALYEASAAEDAFHLISELVPGRTLAELIESDELEDEQVLEIGVTLCQALEHAHARGVIHRDVKPHNVLVPESGRTVAKLADFGGASLTGETALTRAGDVIGTLAYMAPEQSEGERVGVQADLYSLALVLYEALSGVNPVRGLTPAATARRIGEPIESLRRQRREISHELADAIGRALDPDPEWRGTLGELRQALEGAPREQLTKRWLPRSRQDRRTSLEEPIPPGGAPLEEPLPPHDVPAMRRMELPRAVWIAAPLALAIWEAIAGRPGLSLLVLAAAAPLLALPRRAGPGWLAGLLAPILGVAGLASAYPAFAGQCRRLSSRAAMAALGFWWMILAEPLLGRRLWLGPVSGLPSHAAWEASLGGAARVIGSSISVELPIYLLVWAVAASILPWIVRGRHAALDLAAGLVWTIAMLIATPMLQRALLSHSNEPTPRGAVLGAVLGCALAVGARALRGPI